MPHPHRPVFPLTPFGLEQAPDYTLLRDRAHRERSLAISRALAILWKRVRPSAAPGRRDAGFWQA